MRQETASRAMIAFGRSERDGALIAVDEYTYGRMLYADS